MGFMRYRHTYVDGDIGGIRPTRVYRAFMKKMISPSTLSKLRGLPRPAMENVKTDLDIGNLIWLGERMPFFGYGKRCKAVYIAGRREVCKRRFILYYKRGIRFGNYKRVF